MQRQQQPGTCTRATLGRRRELVERLGSRYPRRKRRCGDEGFEFVGLAEPVIERLDAREVRLACSLEELGELAVAAVRCLRDEQPVDVAGDERVARKLDVRTVAVAVLIDDRLESAQLVCEVRWKAWQRGQRGDGVVHLLRAVVAAAGYESSA